MLIFDFNISENLKEGQKIKRINWKNLENLSDSELIKTTEEGIKYQPTDAVDSAMGEIG